MRRIISFPPDPFAELALINKLHALRHLEPGFAGDHGCGNVGAAYTSRKCAQAAVGAGVAIGADHHVAGYHDPLLGQERMFHTHPADLEVERKAVLPRKLPEHVALLG